MARKTASADLDKIGQGEKPPGQPDAAAIKEEAAYHNARADKADERLRKNHEKQIKALETRVVGNESELSRLRIIEVAHAETRTARRFTQFITVVCTVGVGIGACMTSSGSTTTSGFGWGLVGVGSVIQFLSGVFTPNP